MTSRRKVTRRQMLAQVGASASGLGLVAPLAAQDRATGLDEAVPITGKAGPGLELFDAAMLKIMDRHGIPGAALAIAKDGKLVLAKGYGWSNVAAGKPVEPDTLFGLASLSKSITAGATLKLVELGKLKLEDRVFDILKHIKAPPGARVDARLRTITVQQCLNHSGGWDRATHGDCINWEPQICRAYRLRPPISATQLIAFTRGLPLDFDPGTDTRYSNTGYIILGEVIARVSGQSYNHFVGDNVLRPMGMKRTGLTGFDGKYIVGEALRYLAGTLTALPALPLPMVNAAGGWSSSVVDLARFLTSLDGSRGEPVLSEKSRQLMFGPPPAPLKPRQNGSWFGLGWDGVLRSDKGVSYFKDGSYQGMRTFMKRMPNGLNWALLYNASMEFDPQDTQVVTSTVQEVRKLIEQMSKPPDIDLFTEFP